VSRDYELGFILNPEVSEDEIRSLLDRIEQIVANYGGQIFKINQWGRRRLAYPIERHRDGYYIFIDMILTPETVTEIERTLRVSEIVFRHMMKRRDPKTAQKEREARAAAAAQAEIASQAEASAATGEAETPATAVEAEGQAETPAAPVEAEGQAETPAAPVEAASKVETSATAVEAEDQVETSVAEGKANTEEVAATTTAEKPVTLSAEEVESAPPAVEEAIEA
jgi:small subunit ribosomal protein S6